MKASLAAMIHGSFAIARFKGAKVPRLAVAIDRAEQVHPTAGDADAALRHELLHIAQIGANRTYHLTHATTTPARTFASETVAAVRIS